MVTTREDVARELVTIMERYIDATAAWECYRGYYEANVPRGALEHVQLVAASGIEAAVYKNIAWMAGMVQAFAVDTAPGLPRFVEDAPGIAQEVSVLYSRMVNSAG